MIKPHGTKGYRLMVEASNESQKSVGIVVPTYNESESIAALIRAIREAGAEFRIVVVDDSINGDTIAAVEAVKDPKVHCIRRSKKGGRGTAVIEGLKYLYDQRCENFVEMDADFSHPPAQIPELLKYAREHQSDLLIASRYMPQSRIENWPLSRKVFSRMSNVLAKSLLSVPVSDYTNGFRYYSRPAVKLIVETCGKRGTGFIALSEILVSVFYSGMKVNETPTRFINRLRGESSLNQGEIINALKGLMKIYGLKNELRRISTVNGTYPRKTS